jgi:hypothetical protein
LGTCWEQVEKKIEKNEKSWKKVGKKLKVPEYVKAPKQECSQSKSKLVWKVDIS